MITHVATTEATVPDSQMTSVIDDDLARKNLLPRRHYLDSGYLSAPLVAADYARHGNALIGPLLADTSAQARAGNGYARADFTVNYDTKTVTCPQGKTAAAWSPRTQRGKDAIVVTFSAAAAAPGPPAPYAPPAGEGSSPYRLNVLRTSCRCAAERPPADLRVPGA